MPCSPGRQGSGHPHSPVCQESSGSAGLMVRTTGAGPSFSQPTRLSPLLARPQLPHLHSVGLQGTSPRSCLHPTSQGHFTAFPQGKV